MFMAVCTPDGGVGSFPALVQGDPGVTPDIDTVINLVPLEYDDPTADGAFWTETSPNVYKLTLALHQGTPGEDGTSVSNPTSYGTPVHKKILQVNAAATGFEYVSRGVGDRYIPASIANTPSGNAAFTLCSVGVPAQDFAWRPEVSGQCVVTGTGADVAVDLVARLNNESAGNIVGRGIGMAGVAPPTHVLVSGPPAGSADTYDKVSAGAAATIFFRAERQSGVETFTTSGATSTFCVRVCEVP